MHGLISALFLDDLAVGVFACSYASGMNLDEWLDKATRGVDMDSPTASLQIFLNLMQVLPWAALFWWSVGFVVVGALLGWWRGRLVAGMVWAAVLGPLGWLVVCLPRPPASKSSKRPAPPPLRR